VTTLLALLVLLAPLCLPGCGTSTPDHDGADASADAAPRSDASSPSDAASPRDDASVPADADAAGSPSVGDAGPLVLPQVLDFDGGTLAAPKLIAVTFPGDPQAPQIDAFTRAVGASAYWTAVTSEYGVGAATGEALLETEAAPASVDEANGDAEAWLATRFDGTHPEWGTFDPNAVYIVFYPSATTAIQSVGGCGGAYHASIPVTIVPATDGGGTTTGRLLYGIVFRCATAPDVGRPTGLDLTTFMASHEMIEAVTDPDGNAFVQAAAPYVAWAYFFGSEVGDMCAFHAGSAIKPADLGFTVQRTWSNAAAAAFLDPCVPGASDPLFLAAPLGEGPISLAGGAGRSLGSEGFSLPAGHSITIEVAFHGAANGTWTVTPFTYATEHGESEPYLQFSPPTLTGKSGDVVPLTIARVKANEDGNGGDAVKLVSAASGASGASETTDGSTSTLTNEWYFAVTN
jgi:hypothetical protein